MNSFEWFLLLTLLASLVVGPLMGYAAGRRAERAARPRRPLQIVRIEDANGVYIMTPSRDEAERFAAKFGGTIIRVGRPE